MLAAKFVFKCIFQTKQSKQFICCSLNLDHPTRQPTQTHVGGSRKRRELEQSGGGEVPGGEKRRGQKRGTYFFKLQYKINRIYLQKVYEKI